MGGSNFEDGRGAVVGLGVVSLLAFVVAVSGELQNPMWLLPLVVGVALGAYNWGAMANDRSQEHREALHEQARLQDQVLRYKREISELHTRLNAAEQRLNHLRKKLA